MIWGSKGFVEREISNNYVLEALNKTKFWEPHSDILSRSISPCPSPRLGILSFFFSWYLFSSIQPLLVLSLNYKWKIHSQDCNRNFKTSCPEIFIVSHTELSNYRSHFYYDLPKRLGIFSVFSMITSSPLYNHPMKLSDKQKIQSQDCNRNFKASCPKIHIGFHAELSHFCSSFLFDLYKRLGMFSVFSMITSSFFYSYTWYWGSGISKKFRGKIPIGILKPLVQKFIWAPMLRWVSFRAIFSSTFTKVRNIWRF